MEFDLDEGLGPDREAWKRVLDEHCVRMRTVNPEVIEMKGILPFHDYCTVCPELSGFRTKGAEFIQKGS